MPRTRKSGDGGLYFDKKRELWIGVVDNGYTDDGRRRQARVTSKSQTVARDKLRKKIDEIEKYGSPLGNRKVAEWGAFWLSEIKPKMKPQPYRTYESVLNTWVFPKIGTKNLKEVRPSDLQLIYRWMRERKKATSTALKVHNVMSAMFEAARLERLVPINVAKDVRPPRPDKSDRDAFTPDETLRILAAAAGTTRGSKWLISLYAGIRQGERLGATLDSVDLTGGIFTVRWNLVEANYEHGCGDRTGTDSKGKPTYPCRREHAGHCPDKYLIIPEGMNHRVLKDRLILVPPKSGEERSFPIPESLLRELKRDIAVIGPNPHGLLWPALDGSPMTGRADQADWKALLQRAEVDRPNATTHWARHTAISDFTAAGVADRVIGEMVGHKSAGVTGRYQHVSSQDAAEGMKKLVERRSGSDTHPS